MSETGSSYGYESKYNRPEDEEHENIDNGASSEEVEQLMKDYEKIKKVLSSETKSKFDDATTKIDLFYDPEDELWVDAMESMESLVNDVKESMSDEEALAEWEIESRSELDETVKAVRNLSKKHIH